MLGHSSSELRLGSSATLDLRGFCQGCGLLESRLQGCSTSVGTGDQVALLMDPTVFVTSTRQVAFTTL